ncbi:Transforming growth factor beta receptor type 3 [Myotis davidii]|uniref:Transforming growth factor beta receptor type 3 n=1 Tax=Myotis davidii TaxID=225400 RepID=L5M7W6_MYODS|nr:Transforming growth factor beta receptor type 3 [Myotis davidii]
MESFTVLSGCASRGTTGLPQEVHVLNLRGSDPEPGQPQRERNQGEREFELLQKQQQENILVELLTLKTDSNKTVEAEEKHLKE